MGWYKNRWWGPVNLACYFFSSHCIAHSLISYCNVTSSVGSQPHIFTVMFLSQWAYLVAQMVKICLAMQKTGFNSWVGKIPWRRKWQPTPVLLPGKSHGWRSLVNSLCDPIDGSPPGSPVPGILQARTLVWVAISFSNAWKWKVKVKSLSHGQLLATPWTAA